ncbi:MAG: erythronate-4-phosphate dehydrogenase [Ignavibacteriales bacterium CG12_big_fil_rev_8_21_14_0_65_30_8]|nr:MAG: erythronate-4-phosphate dehydrogenase [Ignavibacteriales bacterium CG12_big_fil_rev_8_21_14_0_65_30_8]
MLNILIDENILLAEQVFSHLGRVKLINGRIITNRTLGNADILIVRSITNVNEKLLKNSKVKFVGSATIGFEHIDLDYLRKNKIFFCNAPGSNSYSVAEYVITALLSLAVKYNFRLSDKSIGIIGHGNVGKKVDTFCRAFKMKVLLNDPPLKKLTGNLKYLPLRNILKTDIISLHVPLNKKGRYKTHHLLNKNNLNKINQNSVIVNTSRGSVINTGDFLETSKIKKLMSVLDVWENEPNINKVLLNHVDIGTAHIAGYSIDGKLNGTKQIYSELCKYLKEKNIWHLNKTKSKNKIIKFKQENTLEESIYNIIKKVYDINYDNTLLKKSGVSNNNVFDKLRKDYRERREFNNYTILINKKFKNEINILKKLRFNIKTF